MRRVAKAGVSDLILSSSILCLSLSVSALAGEIVLRLFGHHGAPHATIGGIYPVDDPILDWRHMGNSQVRMGRIVYRYNSSGFRDIDHAVRKPESVKRIVVVGDSVTEGYGVEWESTFSQVVQLHLGSEFEVITISAGGLNTPQEVHLFEQEGLAYKPDLVILNFVLNDCDFYSNLEGAQRYDDEKESRIGLLFNTPINPKVKRLLKSSALIYFAKERLEHLKGRILGAGKTDYFTRIWEGDENRWKVTSGFSKLAGLQRENKFGVLVIVWPLITDYRGYRFEAIHAWVRQEAERMGLSTMDLLPSLSKIPYRELQITAEDNVHPNSLGHKIGAEAFMAWYRSRDIHPE